MPMKLKDDYIFREIAGEKVVIPIRNGLILDKMLVLNETGLFLWERLQKETDADTLQAALLAEYEVDPSVAKCHVAAFIDQLKELDFLA